MVGVLRGAMSRSLEVPFRTLFVSLFLTEGAFLGSLLAPFSLSEIGSTLSSAVLMLVRCGQEHNAMRPPSSNPTTNTLYGGVPGKVTTHASFNQQGSSYVPNPKSRSFSEFSCKHATEITKASSGTEIGRHSLSSLAYPLLLTRFLHKRQILRLWLPVDVGDCVGARQDLCR